MRALFPWIVSLSLTLLVGSLIYFSVPDWGQSWRVMLQGRPDFLLAGLGLTLLHMGLRAWRWGVLLSPVKHPLAYQSLFSLTVAKYVINLIPPRAGEVVASVVLARKERIPAASVIATSLLERILDVVTVVGIFAVYLVLFSGQHPPNSERGQEIMLAIQRFSLIGVPILALALVALVYLAGRWDWTGRIPGRLSRIVVSFGDGFRALRKGGERVEVAVLSLAIWITISLQLWILARAYLSDFPLTGALLLTVITVVGVAIPTPGGVGGFQFFMQLALTHFFAPFLSTQDPNSQAAGISNGCYMVSMVPLLLLGYVLLHREGLSWSRISRIASRKPAESVS
ncbi:MAG: flippase-like domain-containing protein [Acidobacteria bacterium]|nr:flippase-like domain-containing protein [Acidobacteriota bacterium]